MSNENQNLKIANLKNLTYKTYLDFCSITNEVPRLEIVKSIEEAGTQEMLDIFCKHFFEAIRKFARETK